MNGVMMSSAGECICESQDTFHARAYIATCMVLGATLTNNDMARLHVLACGRA